MLKRSLFSYLVIFRIISLVAQSDTTYVHLKTPDLSQSQFMGSNVGVRPYRNSGVRLEAEYLHDKLIVHNYGYGGFGLTLCWGGAHEAIALMHQELEKQPSRVADKTVAVLGAGIIGLATAYDLLEQGYTVHIYASHFSPNLTSNVAAGIWSPPAIKDSWPEEIKQRLKRMLEVSTQRYLLSAGKPSPELAGVGFVNDYHFKVGGSKAADALATIFDHSAPGQKVEALFDNGITKLGKCEHEISLDGALLMEDLFSKVKAKGAIVVQKSFKNKDEIAALTQSIIINCTSLGSRELFDDKDFIPLRGHVAYFQPQVGIDYMVHQNVPDASDFWVTMYPLHDRLLVGGCVERGKEERVIDEDVVNKLVTHVRECFGHAKTN